MRGAPGRDHLLAVRFASKPAPPRRVPRLYGVNHSSYLYPDKTCTSRLRADPMRQPKHAKNPQAGFFGLRQRSKRAYTPRAFMQSEYELHRRAHKQIQTDMPLERYDQESVRVVPIQYGCRPDDFRFHRSGGMLFLNLSMCATAHLKLHFTSARQRRMRVSIAVCEAPEQTEKSSAELFSHVSADTSGPREALRCRFNFG